MADYLKFFDTVEFKPLKVKLNKTKDNFGTNPSNSPLIVKIAATHAGLITRNNGFYLPDRMRKGAASFTAHYGKPVQVHHDENADAVGRVLKAEYIDISAGIRDAFLEKIVNSARKTYSDKFIKDFISGETPFMQSVNFISDALSKDSILDDPNYKGLGYISLTASISDPAAKQKILDGRYLTGSVGVSTNHAICSVCKQDWVTDGSPCEHRPGKMYDGTKAFMITGDLSYDEYSFVNTPADRHSGIMEINVNGIKDSVVMDSSVGRSLSIDIITDNIDITDSASTIENRSQEENMNDKVKELLESAKTKFTLVDDVDVENILKAFDGIDIKVLDEVELAVDIEAKLDRSSVDKIFTMELAKKLDALKTLRPFIEETGLASVVSDLSIKDSQGLYDALNNLEWQDYSESEDEALTAYLAEHVEDAKLSTAQRKRLPGSSFCGPNKSFPVPDCSHVTAARRLIGRASVSAATKTRILGCVSRKASALDCGKSKDSAVKDNKVLDTKVTSVKDDCGCKDTSVLDGVKAELATALKRIEDLTVEKTTLSDSFNSIKKEHTENTKLLDAVRAELKISHEDLVQMADQLVTSKEESVSLLADKVITFKQLTGEKIEDSVKTSTELINLGEVAIKDQLNQLVSKVDMAKITDSINSGLARNPLGTVTDPSGKHDQAKTYTKENVQAVANEYTRIRFGGFHPKYGKGSDAAEKFKRDMQTQGLIPNG